MNGISDIFAIYLNVHINVLQKSTIQWVQNYTMCHKGDLLRDYPSHRV